MKIRRAEIKDVKDISRIHALSWKSSYKGIVPQPYLNKLKEDFWVATFRDWITNNVMITQIIFDEEKVVGCIAYGKSRDEKMSDWGEIVSIYLLPDYFGKGIGKALLKSAIDDMRHAGFDKVYLWVLEENLRAQKFYKKNGFSQTGDKCSCEILGKELIDLRFIYQFK